MKAITFINKSPLPIIIEAWQKTTYGMSELQEEIVKSGANIVIYSEEGEWRLQTNLEKNLANEWIKAKYNSHQTIGKICDEPIKNTHVWMLTYENDFKIAYNSETRTATFLKKSK